MSEPTREWWDGHHKGFVKGLEEARQQCIARAKEEGKPNSPISVALRLLAHDLYEMQHHG